ESIRALLDVGRSVLDQLLAGTGAAAEAAAAGGEAGGEAAAALLRAVVTALAGVCGVEGASRGAGQAGAWLEKVVGLLLDIITGTRAAGLAATGGDGGVACAACFVIWELVAEEGWGAREALAQRALSLLRDAAAEPPPPPPGPPPGPNLPRAAGFVLARLPLPPSGGTAPAAHTPSRAARPGTPPDALLPSGEKIGTPNRASAPASPGNVASFAAASSGRALVRAMTMTGGGASGVGGKGAGGGKMGGGGLTFRMVKEAGDLARIGTDRIQLAWDPNTLVA
ncbi:hypothetical protein T484DRAFT_1805886, partial [Baffinella frigidus]